MWAKLITILSFSLTIIIANNDNATNILDTPTEVSVFSFDLSGTKISSIAEISALNYTDLVNLNISSNGIQQVDNSLFDSHTKLTDLDLSNNPIQSVGLANLKSESLEELRLRNSAISYIRKEHFRGLVHLKCLFMDNNPHLTSLNLSHTALTYLNVNNCSLFHFRDTYLPNVEVLLLAHNRLTTVDDFTFTSCTKLLELDISHNDITSISDYSFIRNTQLKWLNLAHNFLHSTEWSITLKSLFHLDFSENFILDIDILFLKDVKSIDGSNNLIHKLPEELDRLLPKVVVLNVKHNPIRIIKRLKSNTLHSLFLQECRISVLAEDAFQGTPSLNFLNLTDNKLTNLNFLKFVSNVSSVLLGENMWKCNCSVPVPENVACYPSNLSIADFCASVIKEEEDPWYIDAQDPVVWAPLLAGMIVLVVGCISGMVIHRRKFNNRELALQDSDQAIHELDLLTNNSRHLDEDKFLRANPKSPMAADMEDFEKCREFYLTYDPKHLKTYRTAPRSSPLISTR